MLHTIFSAQFANALCDLARVRVKVSNGVRVIVMSLGQKFANCTCTISKLHSTFCKLHRLTHCVQQQ